MDGRDWAFDNIFTECLWRSVKYEEVYLKEYQVCREAREGLEKYFTFYNRKRYRPSLEYKTPHEVHFGVSSVSKEGKGRWAKENCGVCRRVTPVALRAPSVTLLHTVD